MPSYGKFQNGIGLGRKVQNGFDDLVNVNIHDDIASASCSHLLEKKSGSTVNKPCYRATWPDGTTWFFSKTDGSRFQRTNAGVYSALSTGLGLYKGARYHRGYVYYSLDGYLGRALSAATVLGTVTITIASPGVVTKTAHGLVTGDTITLTTTGALPTGLSVATTYWVIRVDANTFKLATSLANAQAGTAITTTGTQSGTHTATRPQFNDQFQVLTTGEPHPLYAFDLILYIGNGKDVAQLDDAQVFTSSGLDLPTEYHISAMTEFGDDLLTLGLPGDYINDSAIFRWNTYSDSWTVKDAFKDTKAYAFLDADNYQYVVCKNGNIWFYNGSVLELFARIRNPFSTEGHQLTTNLQGKPLIANGGRVYSLHRSNRNMPVALSAEYVCSAGENATIHSIEAVGDNLLVNWELSGTYGVDEITAKYATAIIITPRVKKSGVVRVNYDVLPDGCSINIYHKNDGETSWTAHSTFHDSDQFRYVRTVDDIIVTSNTQVKVELVPNNTGTPATPVIDEISVEMI